MGFGLSEQAGDKSPSRENGDIVLVEVELLHGICFKHISLCPSIYTTLATDASQFQFNVEKKRIEMRIDLVHLHRRWVQVLILYQNFDFKSTWIRGICFFFYTILAFCLEFTVVKI